MFKNYSEFVQKLKEGLILTHDINSTLSIIFKYLDSINIKYILNSKSKLTFDITILNNQKEIIEWLISISNNMGYFPSQFKIELSNGMANIIKDYNKINFNLPIKSIKIIFEGKYEDGLYTNDIICPDILYHLTPSQNINSINNKGLYPKSKNRLSVHPDRIHLFPDKHNYIDLLNNLKISDKFNGISNTEYSLIEIDTKFDKIVLHTDPNYNLGFFTYDHISPKIINIILSNI